MPIPPTPVALPIDEHVPAILAGLQEHATMILQAEPGSGKTTRLPAHLLAAGAKGVLVVEPRRLAARLAAERVAAELGQVCGQEVGYAIRFERKAGPRTRLLFITEGLFVRMLAADPLLRDFDYVLLDEFHERNIYADLALMLTRRLQRQRPVLRLVVMSATLSAGELQSYLAPCQSLDLAGRCFPVTRVYMPPQEQSQYRLASQIGADVRDEFIVTAVERMMTDPRCPGHILVFLVGLGQIYRLREQLKGRVGEAWEVLPLAADLPLTQQQAVFRDQGRRKVILATNVAETSVTIPGVTGVIDPGLAKIAGHAPWSGMPTLEIKAISQASAVQRAGRAGRTAPGVVYHLYDEVAFRGRALSGTPDIERLDFTPYLLELLSLSDLSVEERQDLLKALPWFEVPGPRLYESACRSLRLLRALPAEGKIAVTDLGREMVALPLHPRLAAVALAGQELGHGSDALLAACVLSEGRVCEPQGRSEDGPACDVTWQVNLIKSWVHRRAQRYMGPPLDEARLGRVLRLYEQLAKKLGEGEPTRAEADVQAVALCLLHGYPDRVGKLRQGQKRTGEAAKKSAPGSGPKHYHFCLGRGGLLAASSRLAARPPDFLLAIEAKEDHSRSGALAITVTTGCPLTAASLAQDPGGLRHESVRQEVEGGKAVSYRCRHYGELTLQEERLGGDEQSWTPESLTAFVEQNWPLPFADDEALRQYHTKLRLIERAGFAHSLPYFEGELFQLFCATICDGQASPAALAARPLGAYLAEQLSYEQATLLARLTPDSIRTQGGKVLAVNYSAEASEPWVEGFIQDFFGSAHSPTLADGRLGVTIRLKGPNRRECQVTSDLAGFWRQTYPDLRRTFVRRYPRHYWPEDPLRARPVLFAKQAQAERS